MRVVSYTTRLLYPRRRSPGYPMDRRLSGSQSRTGRSEGKKNPCPCRGSNPIRLARNLVTLLTELTWFLRKHAIYTMYQEESSVLWEVIISVILSKNVYIYPYMCPIPNGFRDSFISLYGSKIVDKKEILRTVSNTGIYCSSEKVGIVYLV
jgi:hypothetical protein